MSDSDRASLVADARGQLAPLGVALMTAIVIVGTIGVVVLGGAALTDTQDQSDRQRAEHVLTLFDSRAAMVALGDSDAQTTSLSGDGSYRVDPDSGNVKLVHQSFNNSSHDETLYNKSMGALVYESGGTTVAYQGGGVWRRDSQGDARMVTPPEFFFRQSTLTFPFIRVSNSDSASGSPRAQVRAIERARDVYPNQSASYDSGRTYENALENGTLVVWVESEYYEGWADYFRTRTQANVTTFDSNETVKADLVSLGTRGKFDMPAEGNGLTVRGMEGGGHSLQNFSISLVDEDDTSADFSNLKWSMWAERGQKQIELLVKAQGSASDGDDVGVHIYYSNNSGEDWHGWKNDSFSEVEVGDFDDDGEDEKRARINFTSNTSMTYTNKKIKTNKFDAKKKKFVEEITFNAHDSKVSWEPRDYDKDGSNGQETETSYNITAHYFELMGEEFTLTVKDLPSKGNGKDSAVSEDQSAGRIEYPGSDRYIAYLHVTENEIEIELE